MSNAIQTLTGKESKNFFLIAGPCVIEDELMVMQTAEKIKAITDRLNIPFIFKSSYRKANRSKLSSFEGNGQQEGLLLLKKISRQLGIPVLTDIHSANEAATAAQYVDVLQIPAFLCRQTDILVAAAKTGKTINIKKGQFLSPGAMRFAVEKVVESGNKNILLTERGSMFGYNDLVVDFRGIKEMQKTGYPVVLDVTHSLQQPNQESGVTGGRPEDIETLSCAGIAAGVDGIFIETHPNPSIAKSDGSNMLQLDKLEDLLIKLVALRNVVNGF